jgi:hypothetical protein
MKNLRLSTSEVRVTLLLKTGYTGLEMNVKFLIAWRPQMEFMTIQHMQTMQYLPQIDKKLLRRGVSWIVAIATSTLAVVAYA